MKKASMPINVILVMLVAIISISLLIGLFMTKVPDFSKGIYCKTFFHLHSATFVPDAIRQDQSYCKLENNVDVFLLDNQTMINETFLAYVFACWERTQYGDRNKPLLCYEITVPRQGICDPLNPHPEPEECEITKTEFLKIMKKENLCDLLPINDGTTQCPVGGSDDLLNTDTIIISPDQNYVIEFDGVGIRIY